MRSMVEGAGRRRNDHSDRSVQIGQHIARRHAAQAVAVLTQKPIALDVTRGSFAPIMRLAVNLDAKPRRRSVEVDNIRADRMLPAKTNPGSRPSKRSPEQHFRVAHVAAQLARDCHLGPQHSRRTPSTALRAVPLPVPGRIWGHRPPPRIARASTCCTPTILALAATLTSSGSSLPETQMVRSASMSNVPARSIAQRVIDL